MIEWLAALSPWFAALVVAVPYLSKLSLFVRLLGFLGPFAEPVRVFLEGAAQAVSVVLAYLFKSLWHCLFNPVTYGALMAVYFVGGFYPAQQVAGKMLKKRAAIVQPVKAQKSAKKRPDTRSETLRNFQR